MAVIVMKTDYKTLEGRKEVRKEGNKANTMSQGNVTVSEECISDKTDLNDSTSCLLKVLSFVALTTSSSI